MLGSSGHAGISSCLEWCQVRAFVPRSQPSFHEWPVPHASRARPGPPRLLLGGPSGSVWGLPFSEDRDHAGHSEPQCPCRPGFAQVCGPPGFSADATCLEASLGRGHRPEADVPGPPSIPPGQGLGKPLLRPLGASVLQVW